MIIIVAMLSPKEGIAGGEQLTVNHKKVMARVRSLRDRLSGGDIRHGFLGGHPFDAKVCEICRSSYH